MSGLSLALRMRQREEELRESTCTVRRPSADAPTFDPSTGSSTPAAGSTVYSGPCQVRPISSDARLVDVAGERVSLSDLLVKLPYDVPVAEHDEVTFDASPDALLVGKTARVKFVPNDEWLVTRRAVVEEVS